MFTSANDSYIIFVGTEYKASWIYALTVGDTTLTATTVESIEIDWSRSRSKPFGRRQCKSFSWVLVADLSADHSSVGVLPEDVLTDSAPHSSNAKFDPAFKSVAATNEPDATVGTG